MHASSTAKGPTIWPGALEASMRDATLLAHTHTHTHLSWQRLPRHGGWPPLRRRLPAGASVQAHARRVLRSGRVTMPALVHDLEGPAVFSAGASRGAVLAGGLGGCPPRARHRLLAPSCRPACVVRAGGSLPQQVTWAAGWVFKFLDSPRAVFAGFCAAPWYITSIPHTDGI